jgi:prepilin-type N-terminal cleavage/methylation domain-containing protein
MKRQKGFSLIELLIVVAIILIIAAIAIPNLLKAKMSANEASAVASLRTINTSEVVYANTYNQGFSADLKSLGGTNCSTNSVPSSTGACLLDNVLAGTGSTASKAGYNFSYAATNSNASYSVTGLPIAPGSSGLRTFFTDQSNVIRADPSGAAPTANSNPI